MGATLIRQWWLLVAAGTIAAATAYVAVEARPAPYVATGAVALPLDRAATSDAQIQRAFAIAQIVVDADAVARALADRLGEPVDHVRGGYAVEAIESTTVLKLTFEASTATRAVAGVRALAATLTAPGPVAPGVPGGTLVVTRLADGASYDGIATWEAVLVAAFCGVLLGVVIAVSREPQPG